jgi:nucleotide-binding universal stress UspA family protein
VTSTTDPFLQVIVVGTDGSPGALRAMAWAARLAKASSASVRAVHVLTYNRELLRDITPDTMTNWRRDLERDLRSQWVAPLTDLDVPHRCIVIEDESPATGLIHDADREQSDLIVVGANGHSTLAGRILGSTSYSLTHRARRPVIVVPATWSQPAAA